MIPMRAIKSKAREIARLFKPQRIILFGSYAYGKPDEHSDVDLLVVMNGRNVQEKGLDIRLAVEFGFPVDVIVRSPAEMKRRIAWGDGFLIEIQDRGKILYEAADTRMGGKGRRRLQHAKPRNAGKKVA